MEPTRVVLLDNGAKGLSRLSIPPDFKNFRLPGPPEGYANEFNANSVIIVRNQAVRIIMEQVTSSITCQPSSSPCFRFHRQQRPRHACANELPPPRLSADPPGYRPDSATAVSNAISKPVPENRSKLHSLDPIWRVESSLRTSCKSGNSDASATPSTCSVPHTEYICHTCTRVLHADFTYRFYGNGTVQSGSLCTFSGRRFTVSAPGSGVSTRSVTTSVLGGKTGSPKDCHGPHSARFVT